jgi:hypothetical protein
MKCCNGNRKALFYTNSSLRKCSNTVSLASLSMNYRLKGRSSKQRINRGKKTIDCFSANSLCLSLLKPPDFFFCGEKFYLQF